MTETSLEDNVFELLRSAKLLEATGRDPLEAATKYYEAVYLMHRFLQRLPTTAAEEPKRRLFTQKIKEYEQIAQKLVASASSGSTRSDGTTSTGQKGLFLDAGLTVTRNEHQSQPLLQPDKEAIIHQIHRLVNQGNTKLAYALDLDESQKSGSAIQAYMEAAEHYLKALELATSVEKKHKSVAQVIPGIKKRLQSTLDRVEQLKHPSQGQPSVPKAHNKQSLLGAQKAQSLTPEEISVLKESSVTVSGLFLPWSDADAQQLSNEALRASKQGFSTRFTDPAGYLRLSEQQKPFFYKWARPDEIVRIRQASGLTDNRVQKPILIHVITPYTIKQKCVTDCSFIASLCVTAAFERRFKKMLVTSSIHPQSADGQPFLNPTGKYMVKLWLNGVARCVVVDDYLPIDKYGNLICSHTTGVSSQYLELWVCLIEKAYMKLCDGYDFPGSNSGVDLFSLTGWIPERVHFSKDLENIRDFEILPERAWERISGASSFGDCLITVSSHLNLNERDADRLGLVMGHAYAVLSVIETSSGMRMLQLKNPWAHKSWKGRYSPYDTEGWRNKNFRAEVGYDPDKHQDDGVFWICWDDILNYFQNFHLSWNPFLFSFRTSTHGLWPKDQGPYDDTFNVGENPQYILTLSDESIRKNATVWILLSRHVSKQEQNGAEVTDFLTVHIHRNTGNRELIWYPGKSGNCIHTSAYTNNPTNLVRYDVLSEEDKNLSLVLSQYQKTNNLRYTLSVYCTENFTLSKPRPSLPYCLNRSGRLNVEGGPLGTQSVMRNPMMALSLAKDNTVIEFQIFTAHNIALNVTVFPVAKAGQRLTEATAKAVIDSGKYRHGFLVTERVTLKVGAYVLMVSCYTKRQEGLFQLKCMSSQPVELRTLQ